MERSIRLHEISFPIDLVKIVRIAHTSKMMKQIFETSLRHGRGSCWLSEFSPATGSDEMFGQSCKLWKSLNGLIREWNLCQQVRSLVVELHSLALFAAMIGGSFPVSRFWRRPFQTVLMTWLMNACKPYERLLSEWQHLANPVAISMRSRSPYFCPVYCAHDCCASSELYMKITLRASHLAYLIFTNRLSEYISESKHEIWLVVSVLGITSASGWCVHRRSLKPFVHYQTFAWCHTFWLFVCQPCTTLQYLVTPWI